MYVRKFVSLVNELVDILSHNTTTMNQILKLNRFTTLPYLLDLINQRKLILTNPIKYWEDKNDVGAIQHYLDITKTKSIYAICLTYKSETIHHWNKFANGENGCCIEFNAPKLLSLVENLNLKHSITDYKTIENLKIENIDKSKLIFIKRYLFESEKEYRIIATNNEGNL